MLLRLLVLIADLTNSCFVNFVGVEIASSSARATIITQKICNKRCFKKEKCFFSLFSLV